MKTTPSTGSARAPRIFGLAATSHGFAFAVLEGSKRLVAWGQRDRRPGATLNAALTSVLKRYRPSFVAYDLIRSSRSYPRSSHLNELLDHIRSCGELRLLGVSRMRIPECEDADRMTNQVIAEHVARHFLQLRWMLPKPRRAWDGVDDRIGVFLATFVALAVADDDDDRANQQAER